MTQQHPTPAPSLASVISAYAILAIIAVLLGIVWTHWLAAFGVLVPLALSVVYAALVYRSVKTIRDYHHAQRAVADLPVKPGA